MISTFHRTNITGVGLLVILIAAGIFHMGMRSVADAVTGQKTIRTWSSYGQMNEIRRESKCCYIFALTYSAGFVLTGATVIFGVE